MKRVVLTVALLAVVASSASAQTAPSRGWLDVNFVGAQSMQDAQTFTLTTPLFLETARASATYPELGRATGIAISAGFTAKGPLGFGIYVTPVSYEQTVGLGVTIPHPTVFNRLASDIDVTDSSLDRSETAIDLSAVYTLRTPDALRVRLFAGPTYFRFSQDMVEIIRYNQFFNVLTGANVVDITTFTQNEVEGSAWGFHGGVDVAYFFSRYVGVGGVLRANKGTVTIDEEPLTQEEAEFSVGHTTAGAGLRLRF